MMFRMSDVIRRQQFRGGRLERKSNGNEIQLFFGRGRHFSHKVIWFTLRVLRFIRKYPDRSHRGKKNFRKRSVIQCLWELFQLNFVTSPTAGTRGGSAGFIRREMSDPFIRKVAEAVHCGGRCALIYFLKQVINRSLRIAFHCGACVVIFI